MASEPHRSLPESEQRFRAVFEHAPNGMAIVSLDARFLAVNPALCNMLGYSADEMTRLTVWDITYPEDLAEETVLPVTQLPELFDRANVEERNERIGGAEGLPHRRRDR